MCTFLVPSVRHCAFVTDRPALYSGETCLGLLFAWCGDWYEGQRLSLGSICRKHETIVQVNNINWAGAATAFSGRRHYSLRFFSLTVGKQNPKYTLQDGIVLLWSFWWPLYTAEGRRSPLSSQTNFHFHLMLLTRRILVHPWPLAFSVHILPCKVW